MDNQEHVLSRADVRIVKTKFTKRVKIIYLVVVILSLFIGIERGTWTYHSDGGNTIYGETYPAHDNTYIGWYSVDFYEDSEGWETHNFLGTSYREWEHTTETYYENIVLVIVLYLLLLSLPFFVSILFKRTCKNTSLTITDSKIYGSYNSFIFKKKLEMPIEKVDNLTTISGLIDKFRSGVTLGVCSASGVIKLHFVQNAEEIISASMGRIEEIREKEKRSRVVAPPVSSVAPSTSDKIKELLSMKEAGLITEEEYTKKREELLSNM